MRCLVTIDTLHEKQKQWDLLAVSKRCRNYNVGTHIKHILLKSSMSKMIGSPTALLTASGLRV